MADDEHSDKDAPFLNFDECSAHETRKFKQTRARHENINDKFKK